MKHLSLISLVLIAFIGAGACSSNPEVKRQNYAKYRQHRVYEYELPRVWKGIESALVNYKVLERDPEEVTKVEFKKLEERTLETDWVYSRSEDKYVEYKVNKSPRKKYLQVRIKYRIKAERMLGGTKVIVDQEEEIERLDERGTSLGYETVDDGDSARVKSLLDKINLAILSAGP